MKVQERINPISQGDQQTSNREKANIKNTTK
jgi:hypothetical protein